MSGALQRIAAVANGLTKAELHILIELAAQAQAPSALETMASSRELAQKTGLARASVQTAIDSLNKKQLICSGSGSATQSAVHRLLCLEPVEDPASEATILPEVAQIPGRGGLNTDRGGPSIEPRRPDCWAWAGPDVEPGWTNR